MAPKAAPDLTLTDEEAQQIFGWAGTYGRNGTLRMRADRTLVSESLIERMDHLRTYLASGGRAFEHGAKMDTVSSFLVWATCAAVVASPAAPFDEATAAAAFAERTGNWADTLAVSAD